MTQLQDHASGRYRFLPAIAPYSAGVVATPGNEIVWAIFRRPLPLRSGIERAAQIASEEGTGPEAVCSFALRNPVALDVAGFAEFNERYLEILADTDILHGDPNPLARTNVVPALASPAQPVVYAFAYCRPADADSERASFVAAGAGELRQQQLDPSAIVRPGDTSPHGLREKATVVMDEMDRRIDLLGVTWSDVTAVDVYTTFDFTPLAALLLDRLGDGAIHGIRWFPSTPPISGLDFEMDVRGVGTEIFLET